MKILIVDDEKMIRELLKMYCEMKKFDFTTATNGEDAKEIISLYSLEIPFDIIITDVDMPKMGGISLSEWVKNNYPKVPIILMSGRSEPERHRADAFMQKPLDFKKLTCLVEELTK